MRGAGAVRVVRIQYKSLCFLVCRGDEDGIPKFNRMPCCGRKLSIVGADTAQGKAIFFIIHTVVAKDDPACIVADVDGAIAINSGGTGAGGVVGDGDIGIVADEDVGAACCMDKPAGLGCIVPRGDDAAAIAANGKQGRTSFQREYTAGS